MNSTIRLDIFLDIIEYNQIEQSNQNKNPEIDKEYEKQKTVKKNKNILK